MNELKHRSKVYHDRILEVNSDWFTYCSFVRCAFVGVNASFVGCTFDGVADFTCCTGHLLLKDCEMHSEPSPLMRHMHSN